MSTDSETWTTAIAEVRDDDVLVRGYAVSDLVGKVTYVDAVFLVLTGELPSAPKRDMLDAIFVALIEHGISPSTIITRMLASCGTPTQAAIAGGVLSIADWHGGSGEQLARALAEIVQRSATLPEAEREQALQDGAVALVADHRARGERFEGFGHPQHTDGDPRALLLFDVASRLEVAGEHVRLVRMLEDEIAIALGRRLPVNVTGALAALLLDLGFPWSAVRGLVIAPRTAGLLAHVIEEHEQGGRWRHAAAEDVRYTGPPARPVRASRAG
jgi:citrate synthase